LTSRKDINVDDFEILRELKKERRELKKEDGPFSIIVSNH